MDAVEVLRQNDPYTTRIFITLRYEISDAEELARALEENPFITEIRFHLDGDLSDLLYGVDEVLQWPDWNSLLRVIASRANLEKVVLSDEPYDERVYPSAGVERVFLQAIQQNTSIRDVELIYLRFPIDISTFVDNASSITSFSLYHCDMDSAEREQGTRSLAVALQRNTNIETLEIALDDIYAVPILESLRSNTSLKTYRWDGNDLSGEIVPAHQRLLESTTSIQTIMFHDVDFTAWQFPLIAQAITDSECVSELGFSHCKFNGVFHQSCFTQLQSILQNKQNLKTLRLHRCDIRGGQLLEDIISILSRPDSQLRCFDFQSDRRSLETAFSGIQFKNLLQAIQKSKLLEQFSIGAIVTLHQLQTLMQSIPSMAIRELEVAFDGQILRENANLRQTVLLTIKNNFSLRSVKVVTCREYRPYLFESADALWMAAVEIHGHGFGCVLSATLHK